MKFTLLLAIFGLAFIFADEKTATKPAVASATAERNVQTDTGKQLSLKLTRTPSDPRTGETVQFVLQATEKTENNESLPLEKANVTATITTVKGAKITDVSAKDEGAGRYRFSHSFADAGDYKIILAIAANDKGNISADFPVAVISAPMNWGFWLGFTILSLLTVGVIGAIFSFLGRGENFASKTRKVAPFLIATVIFFAFGTFALAYFAPSQSRTIPATAETHNEMPDSLTSKITVSKESQMLFGIKTDPVETRKIESGLKTTGVVRARPDARAVVVPPVSGRIVLRNGVTLGSAVGRGEQIGTVEQVLDVSAQADLESQRLEAEAQQREIEARRLEIKNNILALQAQQSQQRAVASQARTRLEQARRELRRAENLVEVGAASRRRVEEAQTAVKTIEQEAAAAEKQVELLETQIKAANAGQNIFRQPRINQPRRTFPLVAPVTGIINEIKATSGSQVETGTELLSIVNLSTVLLEANVFEGNLALVRESERASFTSPALSNEVYKIDGTDGRLLSISQSVNAEARTVPVIYEVKNPLQRLREGMFVEITIDTGGNVEVLSVPKKAVFTENGETFVFVLMGGENFERRTVTLGAEGADFYEVKSGVKAAERVVIEGVYQLRTTKPTS